MSVSLKLHERGDQQTTAVLLPSKFFRAVGPMGYKRILSPIPINLAIPSPDGQWMAICSCMPEHVLILSAVRTVRVDQASRQSSVCSEHQGQDKQMTFSPAG